jgi:glycosyltransferase involved in cell wall biosynthesis
MRIGIDLTAIWRPATGMENVAIEMTRALLRADRNNEYILFFANEVHREFSEFVGCFRAVLVPRTHEVFLKNVWLTWSGEATKLDYMHFPIFPPPWRLPCPSGWTLPDATPWLYPKTMKLKSRWYYRVLGGRAVRTNCVLITDTEASRTDLIRELEVVPERIHVIYPGLKSIFRVHRDSGAFDRVRRLYSLPENFVLFVGTLEPRKNLLRLLSAFRMLKTQLGFEPALVIVGRKGWLNAPIFKELMNPALGRHVYLTGYVPDEHLVALYNMARLLIFPSLYEGFGLPCIEAMACGCPVVTSDRGALLEVTADCAVHCNPENVRSIADAILRTNHDEPLRERLIESGQRKATSFSWDHYADRFLHIVGQATEGKRLSRASEQPSSCTVV